MKNLLLSSLLALSLAFAPLCGLFPPGTGQAQAVTELYTTNGQSTLNGTINSAVTSLVVTSAASFPSIAGGSGNVFRIKIDSEIMKVTATSSTTFTIVRGTEGTSAASHTTGATVTEVLTAAALDQIKLDANIIGISGNTGQTALGSTFTLNTTSGTFQDTGLSVTLPAAGYYEIDAHVTAVVSFSAGLSAYVQAKLYNSTDAADASAALTVVYTEVSAKLVTATVPIKIFLTVAGAKTIKLYAARNGAGGGLTYGTTQVSGSASQDTTITWKRLN